ncbi:MAG: APC family permease [Clostridiales Family XIII bacterium]|jgi:amino acid transporter|nr:APC family permease [Clostridiales Family XIII bacterium]
MGDLESTGGVKRYDIKTRTIVFMIFCICAAGCYGIEAMIPTSSPGLTLILLMVIPFVWGLPMALASVELGAAKPVEGGFYKWIQEALGEFWGFQAGWWKTIANYIDSSVYIILAGTYFSIMTGVHGAWLYLFKVALVLVFVWINLRGVKESGKVSNVIGIIIIIMFALITIVGFTHAKYNPFDPIGLPGETWLTSIGGGLAIGIWLYSGYEAMSAIGGEVKNPQIIPRATLIAVPMIALSYILPTAAGLASVGHWESWQEGIDGTVVGYGSVLAQFLGGGIWIIIFGAVAILAQCSIYNSWMTAGTRVLFAMADDNLAPKFIRKVNKKYGVPYIPVIVMAAINLLLCLVESFTIILVIEVLLIIGTQCLLFITMIVTRRKQPDLPRPIKVPGPRPFIAVFFTIPIFVGVCGYLLNGTDYFLGGLVGLMSGPVLYFIFKRCYGGLHVSNPEAHPLNPLTKLAKGDLRHYAIFFAILLVLSLLGSLFLPFYEGDWGAEYYLETYGMDIFQTMLNGIKSLIFVGLAGLIVFLALAKKYEEPRLGVRRKSAQR